MVTFTGNSVGDTATYTCDLGFELIGTATLTCTQLSQFLALFLPDVPVCEREYCINIIRVTTYLTHANNEYKS